MRVVILGAGFGGLEVATSLSALSALSEASADGVDVVLIDKAEGFVFGYSKLDVLFGRTTPEKVLHRYADIALPGVQCVQATIRGVDPVAKRVTTDEGSFDADVLVVALGADLDPGATPGLLAGGNEFYSMPGALAARDALASFAGGHVVVGVTSTPFKCPPAPSETALLVHDYLREKQLRDASRISLVMPLPVPVPPSPDASSAILAAFAERGIDWLPERLVQSLDADRKVAILGNGEELSYDLFLGVPVHHAPAVVIESGLAENGWIPVNPLSLETRFANVYALGDVASVGTPKAGVFAEGQAAVVAAEIAAELRGSRPPAGYDGRGVCYMEFGRGMIAKVDVTFTSGQAPKGSLVGPSSELAADKTQFGSTRAQRWFGKTWSS
jgi:sulfide:quinone oxidoreductase